MDSAVRHGIDQLLDCIHIAAGVAKKEAHEFNDVDAEKFFARIEKLCVYTRSVTEKRWNL